jgi:hypothetical protein
VVTKHHLNLLELYEIVGSSKLDEENKVRFENIHSDCRVANEHGKILKSDTHTTERDKALYF